MPHNEFDRALIDWLQSQEPQAEIRWCSDHMSQTAPWASSWVDVRVPAFELEHPCGWTFSIVSPNDPEPDNPERLWSFKAAYDLDIHAVYDPDPPHYWYVKEIPLLRGALPSVEQDAELEAALSAGPRRTRGVMGGWSVDGVSAALQDWSGRYADRPDLRFVWDAEAGPSEMLKRATEAANAIEAGEAPTQQLAPNVYLSEQAADFLAGLNPLEAEELIAAMKEIPDQHRNGPADPFADR